MQLLQLVAAWLFPHAVCATTTTTTAAFVAAAFQPDCSSSSPASSSAGAAGARAAELGTTSSPSVASSAASSSSSNADQFASTASRRNRSRSASPSCFGVRGAGRLLIRGAARARARSPEKQEAAAPKRDVVGRYLRKISRRLRRARAAAKDPTPAGGAVAVADDTARWREEAVASAIAYCNDTLRRGTSPPPTSPSLDVWPLEGISDTAAHPPSPSPSPPRRRDVSLLDRQAQRTARCKTIPPPPRHGCPLAVSVLAHGEEPPPHHIDVAGAGDDAGDDSGGETAAAAQPARPSASSSDTSGELDMRDDSFEELEYLETFDGDEEMIGRHFITVQL
ncbi:hypothetical protein ACP4OV_013902 [Aristida adscensionis]